MSQTPYRVSTGSRRVLPRPRNVWNFPKLKALWGPGNGPRLCQTGALPGPLGGAGVLQTLPANSE